jgi:hypothetical protein
MALALRWTLLSQQALGGQAGASGAGHCSGWDHSKGQAAAAGGQALADLQLFAADIVKLLTGQVAPVALGPAPCCMSKL